ncbi:sporulation protein [Kineobactrum salinum]|uniref:Sporulation protein n=1 Tax=Kineobactrum salinum TaxID=2708301 RepID=A0A6C0U6D2_9GAMM|nr:sporulation protein [Kineobactrum salinum]
MFSGVFASLLLYLGTLPAALDRGPTGNEAAATDPKAAPKPDFTFYTSLPEQTLAIDVEPAEVAQPRSTTAAQGQTYLLQAGSFRQREDADRRRAELLLLGLEPRVEETASDNGRWFRVYLGPYQTHAHMSRARGLTAAQDIDTLLLKRDRP